MNISTGQQLVKDVEISLSSVPHRNAGLVVNEDDEKVKNLYMKESCLPFPTNLEIKKTKLELDRPLSNSCIF